MKNIKKSLLTLALISITPNLLPHGGSGFGGGFATGAILGTGLTLAATSGGRNDNPESRNIKSIDKDIRYERRQLERANRDYKKGRINGNELDKVITQHEENIKSLQRQRAMVTA